MINYSAWLNRTQPIAYTRTSREQDRAADAWRRINDKPSSVAFKNTAGTTLTAQTVRIESDNSASPSESAAGIAPKRKVIIYGVRNHESEPDTNMREGYRFIYAGDEHRIVDIILTTGEIQAIAEATR